MCSTVPSSLSLWSDCSRSAAPENGRCAWSNAAAAKKTVAATAVVERERSILFYILRCRGRGRRRIQTYPALADPPVVQMHDRDAPHFTGLAVCGSTPLTVKRAATLCSSPKYSSTMSWNSSRSIPSGSQSFSSHLRTSSWLFQLSLPATRLRADSAQDSAASRPKQASAYRPGTPGDSVRMAGILAACSIDRQSLAVAESSISAIWTIASSESGGG